MAAPAGTITRFSNPNPLREDLEDIIYDISPMDTWFLSNVERMSAKNTLHEWQTDALDAHTAGNAAIEGDDFSAVTAADTSRLKNYTQISKKEVVVSGTQEAIRKAGIDGMMAYQIMRKGKALKRDIEAACLQNNAATSGAAASARVAASVETWLYTTLHIKAGEASATTPAPASGIAGTAPTDGTATGTPFAESHLQTALGVAWSNGGEVNVILLPNSLKSEFNTFSGIATRFRDVASRDQAQVVGAADVYVSSFGSHNVVLSRYMRTQTALCLDTSLWGVAYLRPFQTMDIAKSGDSQKKMVIAEWTLVAKNPLGNAKVSPVYQTGT